jgi:translation initiation factor 3 subunit G
MREPSKEESTTIRVSNISTDVREDDIRELFAPFGPMLKPVFLAKDKVTMQSRGFAFVSYVNRSDAERAMAKLQGHGYAHLILKLEWAKPSNRDAGKEGGLSNNAYVSGYGKALPQGLGK